MVKNKDNVTVESNNGVHSKERYPYEKKDSVADRFAKHCEINWNMCQQDYVVDTSKRGKVQDITNTGKFIESNPKMED